MSSMWARVKSRRAIAQHFAELLRVDPPGPSMFVGGQWADDAVMGSGVPSPLALRDAGGSRRLAAGMVWRNDDQSRPWGAARMGRGMNQRDTLRRGVFGHQFVGEGGGIGHQLAP